MISEAPKTSLDKWPETLPNRAPLLEMINETPISEIFVTAKNNSNEVSRILLYLTTNNISFCEWSIDILFLNSFWQKTWNIT